MASWSAEAIAAAVLVVVLVFAVVRPKDLPEAVPAIPGALLLCLLGAIGWRQAWEHVSQMLPTVLFLAGMLMLAQLCQAEGMFDAAGRLMARGSRGSPVRLLALVFVTASVTTALLSLDATIVLLTPVVFTTAARAGARPKPFVYGTAHLANSASLLLPVSNLTNLLALGAAGISFPTFAALMAGPWLVAIGIEYAAHRRYFATDLSVAVGPELAAERDDGPPAPVFCLVVLGLTLAGLVVLSVLGAEPFWAALAGVLAIGVKRMIRGTGGRKAGLKALGAAANPPFLLFVLSLSVIVAALVDHGVARAMRTVIPADQGLVSLLILAGIAAALANLVNNLPAVLVMLPLAAPVGPVAVLAVLIGVNVGPNLTYVGSLATLLWRRIVASHDHSTRTGEFTRLGLITVPACLVLCTMTLSIVASLMGVS